MLASAQWICSVQHPDILCSSAVTPVTPDSSRLARDIITLPDFRSILVSTINFSYMRHVPTRDHRTGRPVLQQKGCPQVRIVVTQKDYAAGHGAPATSHRQQPQIHAGRGLRVGYRRQGALGGWTREANRRIKRKREEMTRRLRGDDDEEEDMEEDDGDSDCYVGNDAATCEGRRSQWRLHRGRDAPCTYLETYGVHLRMWGRFDNISF